MDRVEVREGLEAGEVQERCRKASAQRMLDPRFAAAALSAPPITFMAVLTRNAAPVRSEAALLGAAAKDAVLPTVPPTTVPAFRLV